LIPKLFTFWAPAPVDNFVDSHAIGARKTSQNQGLGWTVLEIRRQRTLTKSTTYVRS
jgi:hypothetical protein